jgi:preprotein translocase subunit SecD
MAGMRKLLFLASLLVLAALVSTGTYLYVRTSGTTVTLRSPLSIQQVTSMELNGTCADGRLPDRENGCYTVGKGFSVDRVRSLSVEAPPAGRELWSLKIELLPADAKAFGSLTAELSRTQGMAAMVFQGEVLAAPRVHGEIRGGGFSLTGPGSGASTRDYVTELRRRLAR